MPSRSTIGKKRRRQDDPEDEDIHNTEKSPNTQKTSSKGASKCRPFACPYYKKNPLMYKKCSEFQDQGLGHLKQHIRRRHNKPAFCPICGDTFQDTTSLNGHIRRRSCQPNAFFVEPDGTTPEQLKALSTRVAATLSREDQWFRVFDIVCPGHQPRPVSPYHETTMCEATLTYIRKYGPEVLIASLRQGDQLPQGLDPSEIEPALSQALIRTLEQLAASTPVNEHRQDNDKGKLNELPLGAESSQRIASNPHRPRTEDTESCFFKAHTTQPTESGEHHEATRVDMAWEVVGFQRDSAFVPILGEFPNFGTASVGVEEGDQFW